MLFTAFTSYFWVDKKMQASSLALHWAGCCRDSCIKYMHCSRAFPWTNFWPENWEFSDQKKCSSKIPRCILWWLWKCCCPGHCSGAKGRTVPAEHPTHQQPPHNLSHTCWVAQAPALTHFPRQSTAVSSWLHGSVTQALWSAFGFSRLQSSAAQALVWTNNLLFLCCTPNAVTRRLFLVSFFL